MARINAGSLAGYRKASALLATLELEVSPEELARLFVAIILNPPHSLAASLGWINNFDNWASTANYHICIASPDAFPNEGARAKRDMWPAATGACRPDSGSPLSRCLKQELQIC